MFVDALARLNDSRARATLDELAGDPDLADDVRRVLKMGGSAALEWPRSLARGAPACADKGDAEVCGKALRGSTGERRYWRILGR